MIIHRLKRQNGATRTARPDMGQLQGAMAWRLRTFVRWTQALATVSAEIDVGEHSEY